MEDVAGGGDVAKLSSHRQRDKDKQNRTVCLASSLFLRIKSENKYCFRI